MLRRAVPLMTLVLVLAGCGGGGGGGGGDAAGETLAPEETLSAPPDVRAGAGGPGGDVGALPPSVVVDIPQAGTITLDEVSPTETGVTADTLVDGKLTIHAGTCDAPGEVVQDLGSNPAGFVQQTVPVGLATIADGQHVMKLGDACAPIPAPE